MYIRFCYYKNRQIVYSTFSHWRAHHSLACNGHFSGSQTCLKVKWNEWLLCVTLSRMGHFGTADGWGGQKGHPSLKSVTPILQWWNLAQLYLIWRRSKKYINHVTYILSSADINIFSVEISNFCYNEIYR